jgi:hypothetical protein
MRRHFIGRENKTNSFIWRVLAGLFLFLVVSVFTATLVFIVAMVLYMFLEISQNLGKLYYPYQLYADFFVG